MKLYDLAAADEARRFSPYCWRVKMALAHKGLDCQYVAWRFTEKEALPQPNAGQVPVLVDGENVIADSWRIAIYLEERYPACPLFGSETARGEALLIKHWTEKTLHPLISRMMLRDVWAGLHEKDRTYFRESREKRFGMPLEEFVRNREDTRVAFRQALEPMRSMLGEQGFVCGSRPGFADYIVFGALQWARCGSNFPLLEPDDPVHGYRDRLLDLFDGLARRAAHLDSA